MDAHTARHAMARTVDAVAETTVALGFSRIGIQLRRRLEEWSDPPPMEGRVALVTGSTSGIGLATAAALARLGAEVHLVGRDPGRAPPLSAQSRRPAPAWPTATWSTSLIPPPSAHSRSTSLV